MTPKGWLQASAVGVVTMLVAVGGLAAASETGDFPREGEDLCGKPADVLFLFDTTGSMGGVLSSAASGANAIMSNIDSAFPGTRFGVAEYRDYEGYYAYPGYASTYGSRGDSPWTLHQPMTTSTTAVSGAVGTLTAGGGADGPESLTRALYESYEDPGVGWGAGRTRIVVVFTDAPPHDDDFNGWNYGSDPGRDAVAMTSDDLDWQTTVANAASAGIRVAGVNSGGSYGRPALEYAAKETGGASTDLTGDFVGTVTNLVLDLAGRAITHAHSDAVLVNGVAFTSVNLDQTHVETNPHPEKHEETFLTLQVPTPVDGVTETMYGLAETTQDAWRATAHARSTIESVSLLGGLVQAEALRADAFAYLDPWSVYGTGAQSAIARVTVAGVPVHATAPNTVVALPGGLGYVVINEIIVNYAPRGVEVESNMIHVYAQSSTTPGAWVDVKVAHAYAVVGCDAFEHDDGPFPPEDPEIPDHVDPIDPVEPPVRDPCDVSPRLCAGTPVPPDGIEVPTPRPICLAIGVCVEPGTGEVPTPRAICLPDGRCLTVEAADGTLLETSDALDALLGPRVDDGGR